MKPLIVQFPPLPGDFLPLWPKYFFSTVFLNTFSLCLSPSVRDQGSHPYETTGKILVVYILIFILLGCKLEKKRFWTEGQ
jgi:hypothetical protein